MPTPLLSFQHISKAFSSVEVLKDISFEVNAGEIHALMGENGAGKSTLMKILMGLYQADEGSVIFEGEDISALGIHDTMALGIAMIHQELLLIPELSVAQNIFLGREEHSFSWVKEKSITRQTASLLDAIGIDIKPNQKVADLSIAEKQMVEIVKAISQNAKIIIMDEPTSALSDTEVDKLFALIADLKSKGVSIIYISHKMSEIFQIADRITVLRDGEHICTKKSQELDNESLIKLMVGRAINGLFPPSKSEFGKVILELKGIHKKGKFDQISFELRAGEIVGLAGLVGAGRTEVARAIAGFDQIDAGEIIFEGKSIRLNAPKQALNLGIAYVSEDRKTFGFIPELSLAQNMSLASLGKGIFLNQSKENREATISTENLNIKARDIHQSVGTLSGGNQQKVVIAKVLRTNPKVIILDEPTRGIDVGAKAEIYKLIRTLAEDGIGIILISSELTEIIGLSDRILVLSQGKQKAILNKQEATQEKIMQYAVHS
jgi:inositol transport system ATP-binding protein